MNYYEFEHRLIEKIKYLHLLDTLSDKMYLKIMWRGNMHRTLNLKNPKSFNEKLQYLKLYDRNPMYHIMVDKYEAKKYVANKIGVDMVIPTYGIWNRFDDIDFSLLPKQFVLKTTHDSGGVVICRNKDRFDIEYAKKKLNTSLARNYYLNGREWCYKDVKPRILAEKYLEELGEAEIIDYKFYCFHGEPKFLYISQGLENHNTARLDYVMLDWTKAPFYRSDYKHFEKLPPRPQRFEQMLDISRELSKGIPFIRVDLYEIAGEVFWSELTFYPGSGFSAFEPNDWEDRIGEWLEI